ncbi:MAG: ABC transporter ATP-binding protein [Hyphomicrobiaceae bacterium]
MTYLVVENLVKRFGSFVAVDRVSITMAKGEVCTLLGPSGCGKTTTLRSIAGLETFDSGRVSLDGVTLADPSAGTFVPPEKRNLGMVFQSYALWPHKTVGENVSLGLKIAGLPAKEITDRVAEVLTLVGMGGTEKRSPSSLSGGQQQRVAVARALALQPKCLLFDEPLSNLDLLLRERMRFEIRELLVKLGITAVYVTHDQTEAMVISDHIVVMNQGKVEQEGAPTDIYTRPSNRFTAEFLGRTNLLPLDRARSEPATSKVAIAGGPILKSAEAARVSDSNEPLMIAFRPEMARLVRTDETGDNVMDGKVTSTSFLGSHTQVGLSLSGHEVNLLTPGHRKLANGESVRFAIDPANVLVIVDNVSGSEEP